MALYRFHNSFYQKKICFSFTIFVFVAILNWPSYTNAQESTTLRILVKSAKDGTPIPGANVVLLSEKNREKVNAGATNNYGLHDFTNLNTGSYILKVSFVGYKIYKERVSVKPEEVQLKIISLETSTTTLENLVVEGEREVTTGEAGLIQISPKDISRVPTPIIGGDLAAYLQTVPGIITPGDRGGQLYIRGGAPWQNKILVDGLPIVKPFHISNLFSAFPTSTIQNVDVFTGGFGAEYLDATSAIIDVTLEPGNYKEFEGSASLSPYLASVHIEGPLEIGNQSFIIAGRKSLYNQTAPFLSPGKNAPMKFYDLTGRYTFQGSGFTCNVTGIQTFDQGQIGTIRDKHLSWQNTVLGSRCLGFDETFDRNMQFKVGYSFYKNSVGTAVRNNRASSNQQIYLGFDHSEVLFGLLFNYGFDLSLRSYNAQINDPFTPVESFNYNTSLVSTYVGTPLKVGSSLSIQPSVGMAFNLSMSTILQPRLRIEYRPSSSDRHKVSFAAGRYSQLASGVPDVRNAGTFFTALKPSAKADLPMPVAIHGMLGYQLTHRYFNISIEGYLKRFRNILIPKWTPIAKVETETTRAEALAYGFSLFTEYNRSNFYFLLAYGYAVAEYKALTDNLGAWVEGEVFSYHPPYDQRHKINAVISYQLADFTLSSRWEFGSGRPFTKVFGFDLALDIPREYPTEDAGIARTLYSRPYGGRLPLYHRLDISVKRSFQLTEQVILDIQAGALNIYNRKNIFFFDSNTLTRVNQTAFFPYVSVRTRFN